MKVFYEKLQKAGHSRDERIAKLAKVCQMDLKEVQKNQSFEE